MEHKGHCKDLLGMFSDYVDGDLAAEFCTELERHLAECENCRIIVDTLRRTVYLVQVTKEPALVPDDVRQRLYRSLRLDEFL